MAERILLERERVTRVGGMLRDGGWALVRRSKHKIYRRVVLLEDGGGVPSVVEQTHTSSCTPSDHRSYANELQVLLRHDSGVLEVLPKDWLAKPEEERVPQMVYMEQFNKMQQELFTLQREKSDSVNRKQAELDELALKLGELNSRC